MSEEKLKVGIVGMGAIGTIHSNAYNATGRAQIAAICDIDQDKLAKHGPRLGVDACFENYRDLLATDVEAVSVCVPNNLHREITVAALQAGKHVLCEKPMAMSPAEADEMIAALRAAGTVGQMGMVMRQQPVAQLAKSYVEGGHLGEIYHIRANLVRRRGIPGMGGWFTTKAESGGGPLIDVGVHWLDLSMWLSGQWTPTAVSAATYQKLGYPMENYTFVGMWAGPPKYDGTFDVEDYAAGFVRFGSECTLSFEIAWAANTAGGSSLELLGDKGGLRIEGKKLTLYTEHNGKLADITPQFNNSANMFEVQKAKFVAACRGEADPPATFAQGRTVLNVLSTIYASSEAGKELAVG